MSPRMICALSGLLFGLTTDPRLAMFSHGFVAVAVLGAAYGFTRPRGLRDVSDAVLYEAHRAAQRLHDDAGADAIAAELGRRREVARG